MASPAEEGECLWRPWSGTINEKRTQAIKAQRKPIGADWLEQVVANSTLERFDRVVRMCSDKYRHRHVIETGEQLKSSRASEIEIEKENGDRMTSETSHCRGFRGVSTRVNKIRVRREKRTQRDVRLRLVIDTGIPDRKKSFRCHHKSSSATYRPSRMPASKR